MTGSPLPVLEKEASAVSADMIEQVAEATRLLSAIANEGRLLLLCLLADQEKTVSELEELTGLRQPTVSQQLAKLRQADLVQTRRCGKAIYYRISSPKAQALIQLLHQLYCKPSQ